MERTRMTNCKRIHMMNCEELAKFLLKLINWNCNRCPAFEDQCWLSEGELCEKRMIEWLEKEIKQ